jgi:uncharacterized membrane protein (DUF4010 family)
MSMNTPLAGRLAPLEYFHAMNFLALAAVVMRVMPKLATSPKAI